MKITKLLVGFLVVLLLSFVWLTFKPGTKKLNAPARPTPESTTQPTPTVTPVSTEEISFQETGNLVYDEGSWYLVYEEPGAPALNLELKFTQDSQCFLGEDKEGCDLYQVKSGSRVTVSGVPTEGELKVTELRTQK